MRQKPQARAVFQAGASTRSEPVGLDKDSKNGLESQDEVVGILKYTTRVPVTGLFTLWKADRFDKINIQGFTQRMTNLHGELQLF